MTVTYSEVRAVAKTAGYDRVLVDGVDVTYVNGFETVIGEITLTEPFAYGPTTLAFPGIDGNLESGSLPSWAREDAAVVIQRVDDPKAATPTVLATDYRGFVVCTTTDGRNFALEVGGQFSGPASMRYKPDILARRVKDLGFWFANVCQELGLGLDDRDGPTTGIEVAEWGAGQDLAAWAGDICAWSQTSAGGQRTIMPKTWGGNVWGFGLKDTTTKHLTLFTDDARVVPNLRRDRTQIPNVWYGTGVTPSGVRWRNARYPGVFAGPAPTFPGNMTAGDTNATTTTGDGVTVLQIKLIEMGYLSTVGLTDGTFGSTTTAAVQKLQDDADLSQTGTVNLSTWNALFDVSATGYSLSDSHIAPLVQDPRTRKYNYTANGSVAGLNSRYDPRVKRVERFINFGDGVTKAQAIRWCQGEQARLSGKNWTGTITLNGNFGGFSGQWGTADAAYLNDPATGAAHIMSPRDIRPGMNAWLPMFDGGTLVHISGVSVDPRSLTVTLTVDTLARDFLDLAAIKARNKDAARHIRREWFAANRPSKPSSAMVSRDELFGLLDRNVSLVGGEWNVVPMIVGQQGQVNRVDIRLVNDKAEFAYAILTKPMTKGGRGGVSQRLKNKFGNPLLSGNESWMEKDAFTDWYDDRVILLAEGWGKQPCGYGPSRRKYDDSGNRTSAAITGRQLSDENFSYICAAGEYVVIYLAIYPDRDCTLKRGQILWAQLDDAA